MGVLDKSQSPFRGGTIRSSSKRIYRHYSVAPEGAQDSLQQTDTQRFRAGLELCRAVILELLVQRTPRFLAPPEFR
jgi:hypothetical protein